MSKDDFVSQLLDNGFKAELSGGVPMVYVDDMELRRSVSALATECGYNYSYGVKLKNTQ